MSAPIYLGDSMQLRYDTGTLTASQSIELETRETLPGQPGPITFSIPKELARHQNEIDQLISEMATNIDEGQDPERVADNYQMTDESRKSITAVAALMKELHAAGRNHVWAYYIRNMIRPAVIAEQKVDRIIGNPPWLTYGQSADIIRQELRDMSEKRYRIWAGGKLAPHQDIATLFYTRCAELYAKPQTIIGMVIGCVVAIFLSMVIIILEARGAREVSEQPEERSLSSMKVPRAAPEEQPNPVFPRWHTFLQPQRPDMPPPFTPLHHHCGTVRAKVIGNHLQPSRPKSLW